MLRLVAGLEDPTTGAMFLNGKEIDDCPDMREEMRDDTKFLGLAPLRAIRRNDRVRRMRLQSSRQTSSTITTITIIISTITTITLTMMRQRDRRPTSCSSRRTFWL